MTQRVYLDWNATAPLRPEARAAMLAAMDALGNPSSVHAEGRAARAILEVARADVAALAGCAPEAVVFTSGATEAAALAAPGLPMRCSAVEHDAVALRYGLASALPVDGDGVAVLDSVEDGAPLALMAAQNETGALQPVAEAAARAPVFCDAAQAVGRVAFDFDGLGIRAAAVSAHKLGGPAGVGAAILRDGRAGDGWLTAQTGGGFGQEKGARPGTQNLIGVAGFGAAAAAAARDLDGGVWERVRALRDAMEARLVEAAPDAIIISHGAPRLPNTTCVATPGWRAETQVMQVDLAGFAVSAGAACSSGKVGPSRALRAMGLDEDIASSAIRISLGPTTTRHDIDRFCAAWAGFHARRRDRAA
ncbi:cysteine desulfurase family protein [Rubrimonas cliftonensis]|uniref:Cysteine desulfurase n=1 Tax=Rubrimonas cliftonensis TaxID=89524 RepID=A0A1H4BCA6_9RHOB|nr:aminotransferase class V-fold PLP-dependent enzyme [Rubrimonas cliftonensis]SEA45770.1 cysteine desulfurase [Rubrimonas cliftonensis]